MTKYKNKKVEVDGILFDSKKEAARYLELKLLEEQGKITGLQLQVKFVLIPKQYSQTDFTKAGKPRVIEQECTYIADFVYEQDGKTFAEDVKGYRNTGSAGYAMFVIKRKLMLQVHGIKIKEV